MTTFAQRLAIGVQFQRDTLLHDRRAHVTGVKQVAGHVRGGAAVQEEGVNLVHEGRVDRPGREALPDAAAAPGLLPHGRVVEAVVHVEGLPREHVNHRVGVHGQHVVRAAAHLVDLGEQFVERAAVVLAPVHHAGYGQPVGAGGVGPVVGDDGQVVPVPLVRVGLQRKAGRQAVAVIVGEHGVYVVPHGLPVGHRVGHLGRQVEEGVGLHLARDIVLRPVNVAELYPIVHVLGQVIRAREVRQGHHVLPRHQGIDLRIGGLDHADGVAAGLLFQVEHDPDVGELVEGDDGDLAVVLLLEGRDQLLAEPRVLHVHHADQDGYLLGLFRLRRWRGRDDFHFHYRRPGHDLGDLHLHLLRRGCRGRRAGR